MKAMNKLFALGVLGGGVYAVVRAIQRGAARNQQTQTEEIDIADFDEPVIVTEEVIVVTEASPYEDVGMFSGDNQPKNQNVESPFEPPGRGAGPR
jgi:hypothetical protein